MKETVLGIRCPFCTERLKMESYSKMRPGSYPPRSTIFCDNDNCEVKPSTIDTYPSAAYADVEAWR